ncbi:M48 family metallopeptidase [bacterium]|nr:M48 family metallopeptidase [bacterium]
MKNLIIGSGLAVGLILLCCAIGFAQTDNTQPIAGDTMGAVSTAESTPAVETAAGTESSQENESVYPLSPERKDLLIAYSQFNNLWRFVSFGIGIATLAILLFTGLSARFRTLAQKIPKRFFAIWVFFILIMLADYLLNFPASYYRNFVVEHDFGFSNQTLQEWLIDDLKGLGITLVIGVLPVWFFYKLVGYMKRWWLAFTLGAIPFAILIIVVAPVLISPLFNDFTPLEDKHLESEILTLADKAGIHGSDVFQVDASKQSTKINAYVTGLFNTKRIVLYDTMIENFSLNEIRFVMGHEMGHYVMNHIWWGLGLFVLFMLFALWLTDLIIHPVIRMFSGVFKFDKLEDIASLPLVLIAVSVISFVFQPVDNYASRYMEHQADIYGMDITGVSGDDAAIAFDKLSVYNLSDPNPPEIIEFWFYSHPALSKRMAFVRSYHPEGS